MKNSVWMKLMMAVLVAGLMFTVSCAKKTVVSEPTKIESKEQVETKVEQAQSDADMIKQQKIDEQRAAEMAMMEAKAMAAKNRFENQDIHFEYDSSELSAMAKLVIKEKAAWLKENYSVSVTIEGHCDERGTTDYNLALGERRANAVKMYLINLGVVASRLNTISYGEEQPVDMGKTESAYRKNRRAHFSIN